MKVKVCGLTNIEDALLCESLGADAIGYIFYDKSKRYVLPKTARQISESLSPFTLKAGVFVDEEIETVREIFVMAKLNFVQLHGSENFEYIKKLNLPFIKTIKIKTESDFEKLELYNGATFLLDTFSDKAPGGTGESFNWNLIPYELRNKIILAGGVSAENIEEIVNTIKPFAIDLSSSIESAPGKKDKIKTELFFNKLNNIRR